LTNDHQQRADRVRSSAETAVVVRTLWAEYVWLDQHVQAWTVVRHGESRLGEKTCDVLRLQSRSGETRDVYFDISDLRTQKSTLPETET
jgi:hypothetical protein